ncbi:MAG: ABC transporter permease [Tuberibacillus sp.]
MKTLKKLIIPFISLICIFIIWEVIVRIFSLPTYLLPTPSNIFLEMIKEHQVLWAQSWVTIWEIIGGYVLAIIFGIPCAMLIVFYPSFERSSYPVLVFFQTVPKIAIAPLFLVWFGVDTFPKILIAFLMAFFPIVIDSTAGLRTTSQEMVYLARSMGASRLKILTKIQFPTALPHIFSGLKVAITLAVVGAIVGEFVGANKGLGYLLLVANGNLNTTAMFAALAVLTFIGLVFFYLIELLEKLVIPWHISNDKE